VGRIPLATMALASVVALGACGALSGTSVDQERRVAVGDFTATDQDGPSVTPAVTRDAAERSALEKLTELNGAVHGLVVVEAHFAPRLTTISDAAGSPLYASTDPADVWVFVYAAPPQNGVKSVLGLVVVDAATGRVSSAQILQRN
jgi:hypothetical protein